ncbi:MAG: 5-dehydro-4-deoxy-D-glucuronate isomerase [Clostridiales bacterium]|jgi:4-deoxy-L-threo-5-hexosulose-uronate ketol-isomerase|nr:5-dehydro-4-deoxy-D-glucuronate isomerase [Clostridiales bacterium]
MEIRYSVNPKDFKRYTTQELRNEFLIETLYQQDSMTAVYSHVDRMVTLGCFPITRKIAIDDNIDVWASFGTKFFLERREIGIFNLGGNGIVSADDTDYLLGRLDCLYIAKGVKKVFFSSVSKEDPAKFYMVSAPAHKSCKTTFIGVNDAAKKPLGASETANKRVINQFIHPDVLETCQLSMGLTVLEPGSVWNTLPAHTHGRRMEVYTYFDIPEGNVIFHMMGEGTETRHIVMKEGQAVISPSWSIHSGCGTSSYSFIWAMGGENQAFDDMDVINTTDLM